VRLYPIISKVSVNSPSVLFSVKIRLLVKKLGLAQAARDTKVTRNFSLFFTTYIVPLVCECKRARVRRQGAGGARGVGGHEAVQSKTACRIKVFSHIPLNSKILRQANVRPSFRQKEYRDAAKETEVTRHSESRSTEIFPFAGVCSM